MSQPLVCFSHGKESGPWGSKIRALARTAEEFGFDVISIDYRGEPNPEVRVEQLLRECPRDRRPLVLVGSSLGSYVATVASRTLRPAGLFLLAPAFYIEGYREQAPVPVAEQALIIHGWDDQVVPAEHSLRYARAHKLSLLLIDGGHRLENAIPLLCTQFTCFLRGLACEQPRPAA